MSNVNESFPSFATEQKKNSKLRWVLLLVGMILLACATVVGCSIYSLHKVDNVMNNSGYVEEWTENVDGESLVGVPYGDKEWNKLDVFFPKELTPEKSHAAFVYIHGGAWTGGNREHMVPFARRMTKLGYISASVGYMLYRRGETDSFYSIFSVLDEIDCALTKLKTTVEERGIKLERVALGGDSAGGHILSLYAYSHGKNAPVPVAFIAPRVAPIDFHEDTWNSVLDIKTVALLINGMNHVEDVTPELLLNPDEKTENLIREISPLAYLSKESAIPTVAAYGGKDPIVGMKHYEKLIAKFKELGAKSFNDIEVMDDDQIVFDCFVYPHSGHMLENDNDYAKQFHTLVLKYAEHYLNEHVQNDSAIVDE